MGVVFELNTMVMGLTSSVLADHIRYLQSNQSINRYDLKPTNQLRYGPQTDLIDLSEALGRTRKAEETNKRRRLEHSSAVRRGVDS